MRPDGVELQPKLQPGISDNEPGRLPLETRGATINYQHRARGANELITTAIDAHIQAEQTRRAIDNQSDAGGIWRGR